MIAVINNINELYQKLVLDDKTILQENYHQIYDFLKATEFSKKTGCNCSIYEAMSEQLYKSFGGVLSESEKTYFKTIYNADQVWVYWNGELLYKIL